MLRLLLPTLLFANLLMAQGTAEYPDDYLSPAFHAGRRAAFREKMPQRSVAMFFASPQKVRNNDVNYIYAPSKNLYYLTGLEEPNALLLLFKQSVTLLGKTGTEFIFVQPRNPQREMWTGKILGPTGVMQKYQMENVFTTDQFSGRLLDFAQLDTIITSFRTEQILFKYPGRGDLLANMAASLDSALLQAGKIPMPSPATAILHQLRGIKQPEEIALMEKVINMSVEGHNRVIRTIRPGMHEYDAQALMEYEFKSRGSEYVGYPSINGSGANSCILHYETNQRTLQDGDLLLNDCGAEYHGYSADVTRTIPVNGKFSPEQKIIYELVLAAQDAAFALCKPGNQFSDPHNAALKVITAGLKDLGIIQSDNQARIYFPHGTSHHLGLDVHDMGSRSTLQPGMIFTVEPGIYIPPNSNCDKKWWSIGVRIEDDLLITSEGYRNLSAGAPRTVEEIEKMAKSAGKKKKAL
ncbi:MAG: aminopeptidase P family protein [Chitinophagaceae bacterium]|nr:aminopeptidase P family protein [Chitinophagaceae bacterium]MCA6478700.1 aminopeptidase P family protein [Chitinophagaceae bacterium]